MINEKMGNGAGRANQSVVIGEPKKKGKKDKRLGSTARALNVTIKNLPSLGNLHRIGNIRKNSNSI